jgi:myosin heavy subunit
MFREENGPKDVGYKIAIIGPDFQPLVQTISQVLHWQAKDLNAGLTGRTMTLRGETTRISFDIQQAQNAVNALVKEIYGRIFNFIVYQANQSLRSDEDSSDSLTSIGVLDIFGFEKFKTNSFEQLCINYANEKLQQYFIGYVLKKEQELYAAEGIETSFVIPIDNSDVLQLIEGKKNGIFARLDDELKLPKGSDETFLKKVDTDHNNKSNLNRRFLREMKMTPTQFDIRHFAGQIRYDCVGFMEKNRDKLFEHLEALLASSGNERFRELMTTDWTRTADSSATSTSGKSNSSASATISTRFQAQLQSLMDILNQSQPHFIKCIKANNVKEPDIFEEELVLQQLRYSGVLEAIQIRKSGYPTRRTHSAFWKAFWMVPPYTSLQALLSMDDYSKCAQTIQKLREHCEEWGDIQLGRTLVFLRSNTTKLLEIEKESRKPPVIRFTQTHYRRRKALAIFKQKCKIRNQLRIAQANGNRFRASNIAAIDELHNAIMLSIQHELPTPWIKMAENLLQRLRQVKKCLDELATFELLSKTAKDVADEYNQLNIMVQKAKDLDIESPQVAKVEARIQLLHDRATCVNKLRECAINGDEEGILHYLEVANRLTLSHGAFCESDEVIAKKKIVLIEEDHDLCQKIVDTISSFQQRFEVLFGAESVDKNLINAYFNEFDVALNQQLQLWQGRTPSCDRSESFNRIVQDILLLHKSWNAREWNEVMKLVQETTLAASKLIPAQETGQKKKKWMKYCSVLEENVRVEIRLVQHDIHVNVLQPKFMQALVQNPIVGSPGDVDLDAIDCSALIASVNEVRGYGWLDSSAEPLVVCVELFLELKEKFKYQKWEIVLSMAEEHQQKEERMNVIKNWFDAIKQSPRVNTDEIDEIEATINTITTIDNLPGHMKKLDEVFSLIKTSMMGQTQVMLLHSVLQVVRMRLMAITHQESPSLSNIFDPTIKLKRNQETVQATITFLNKLFIIYKSNVNADPEIVQAIDHLESSLVLWELFDDEAWSTILSVWESNKSLVLTSRIEPEQSFFEVLDKLRSSAFGIVLYAQKQSAIEEVTDEIRSHHYNFSTAYTNSSAYSVSVDANVIKLRKLNDTVRSNYFKLNEQCALEQTVEDVENLLSLALCLADVRETICSSKLDIQKGLATLRTLREKFYSISSASFMIDLAGDLLKEMDEVDMALKFEYSLKSIRDVLKPESTDLQYLIPAAAGAVASSSRVRLKRPTSVNSSMMLSPSIGNRAKSSSFDSGNSPVNLGNPDTFEEVLMDDGLVLNHTMLNTNSLNDCLEQAHDMLSLLDGNEDQGASAILQDYIDALEHIRDMRGFINDENWEGCYKVLNELLTSELDTKVVEIQGEVHANADTIRNYAVIMACHNALSKGQPVGPIGQVDYKNNSLNQLEEAIKLCQAIGCVTDRARALFDAVLIIADLRKAQKVGDWAEVRTVLLRADAQHIGEGLSALCCGELSKACIERDNYEMTQLLKNGIVNEEMFTKEGLLEIEQVSVKDLSAVISKVHSMPEDTRGSILKSLYILADSILKLRKCAMQSQWQTIESILPVIKENIENFQNEIESKDKQQLLARKTIAFRTTSFRIGSTSPKDKQRSMLPSESLSPLGGSSGRSASWDEFVELVQSVRREVKAVEHHFSVIELEKNLNEALAEHGAHLASDGNIDKSSIKTEHLREVLEKATNLDLSNLSLPKHLKSLRKVGMLIYDIRVALMKEQWDAMSSLLEETLSSEGAWPECCTLEIQAVRREVENRWIINNLTSALMTGKLEGAVGETNLSKVAFSHLPSFVETAKSLNPRTEASLSLVRTVETIQQLRAVLLGFEGASADAQKSLRVDWTVVRDHAKKVLAGVEQKVFHSVVIPEVRLVLDTAEDELLCSMLVSALEVGGPTGEPGSLQIHKVVTKELEKVYSAAIRSPIKTTYAKHLLNTCRTVQKLREAIVRAESSANETNRNLGMEAWRTVRGLLGEIAEAQAEIAASNESYNNHTNNNLRKVDSWKVCATEIDLIRKHSYVEELKMSIIETTTKASHIYYDRNNYAVTTELTEENIHLIELAELASEAEKIHKVADSFDFDCYFLSRYKSCITAIHSLRKSLAEQKFEELYEHLCDANVRNYVSYLSESKQEFAWILCEYHNCSAIRIVKDALISINTNEDVKNEEQEQKDIGIIPNEVSTTVRILRQETFIQSNQQLMQALQQAQKLKVTSKLAKQWLECCEYMYLLRNNLEKRNHATVNHALRWFRSSVKTCPLYVKMQAQHAYVIHQNDVLIEELNSALGSGKALGRIGEINVDNINTNVLSALIKQASNVQPLFPECAELVTAAQIALDIRFALKEGDKQKLREIMDKLSAHDQYNLLIVDEIATARSELDNFIAVNALIDALKSFEDSETRGFDISFLQDGGNANTSIISDDHSKEAPLPKKSMGYSILESLAERRYSFANKHSANIDPETIDVDVLDRGLRVARDHGIHSRQALRLYRTVELIKALRQAMKQADWARLEEILAVANYEQEVGVKYDIIASKEILAVRSQLEIRAAIVDLSKALRVGWAKCNQGMVDTSCMDNEQLADAIDCADRCVMELAIMDRSMTNPLSEDFSSQEQRRAFVENSPVHIRVKLLMDSAKLVLRIREVLAMGNMELAGTLADEALSQPLHHSVVEELRLYAKEINIALSSMSVAENLRKQVDEGKIKPLAEAIEDAVKLDSHLSSDLGLLRVLDIADRRLRLLQQMRSQLQETIRSQCNSVNVEEVLRRAQSLRYCDEELQQCEDRLRRLKQVDSLATDLDAVWIAARNDRALLKRFVDEVSALQLNKHPQCLQAKLFLRANNASLRAIKLHHALKQQPVNIFAVCTETMRMKRSYLEMPSSLSKYRLENFPKLRRPEDFAQRMTIISEELLQTMLIHSDQPLPTSLTVLTPPFATISVLVFTDYVRGIENNLYSYPAVALRQITNLGRVCIHMRDEIFLQLVKQLRMNSDFNGSIRLWKLLCVCLYHFPPSSAFESFLELFLLQASTESSSPVYITHAQRALRFLHRAVFLFGQQRPLPLGTSSLEALNVWLLDDCHWPADCRIVEKEEHAVHFEATLGLIDLSDPAFPPAAEATNNANINTTNTNASANSTNTAIGKTHLLGVRIRGSRDDWLHRFRVFQGRDQTLMNKLTFCTQLANSIHGKCEIDRTDRDALVFLVYGKRVLHLRGLFREFRSAERIFHFSSDDEAVSSTQRRLWLLRAVSGMQCTQSDASTDLFFSQLQTSELVSFAERFWEVVIDRMCRECKHFPFLRFDRKESIIEDHGSRNNTNSNTTNNKNRKGPETSINWEIFRELVLTGMQLALQRC